jgi:ankyrin repeat protein
MLVTKGANVSCNDTRGESIHNVALRLNRIEVLHYLNERNKPATNSNAQSLTETQLHDAAQSGNFEELQQLLSSKNNNVNAKNLLGATSLHIAASK